MPTSRRLPQYNNISGGEDRDRTYEVILTVTTAICAPGGTRTPNPILKRDVLSLALAIQELQVQNTNTSKIDVDFTTSKGINLAVCGGGWLRSYSSGFSDRRFY